MVLKLYVWENVLEDYTEGMACAIAESEEKAWELLKEKDHTAWWILNGSPKDRNYKGIYKDALRPREITIPEAFVVWGGG